MAVTIVQVTNTGCVRRQQGGFLMKKVMTLLVLALVLVLGITSTGFAETMIVLDTTGEEPVVWKEIDGVVELLPDVVIKKIETGYQVQLDVTKEEEKEISLWNDFTWDESGCELLDYDFELSTDGLVDVVQALVKTEDERQIYLIQRVKGEMRLFITAGQEMTRGLLVECLNIGFKDSEIKGLLDEKLCLTRQGVVEIYQKLVGYNLSISYN